MESKVNSEDPIVSDDDSKDATDEEEEENMSKEFLEFLMQSLTCSEVLLKKVQNSQVEETHPCSTSDLELLKSFTSHLDSSTIKETLKTTLDEGIIDALLPKLSALYDKHSDKIIEVSTNTKPANKLKPPLDTTATVDLIARSPLLQVDEESRFDLDGSGTPKPT